MKTADGELWTAAKEQPRAAAAAAAAVTAIKQTRPSNKATPGTIKSNKVDKPPIKMKPTQMLVSRNEGSALSSWFRDIGTMCIPLYLLYIIATHPLIKDIGQPHTRKWTKVELREQVLHEHKQQLEFETAVKTYNFQKAMNIHHQCFQFPNFEFTSYQPKRSALFQERYKKWLPQNRKDKGALKNKYKTLMNTERSGKKELKRGFLLNARKNMMMPHKK